MRVVAGMVTYMRTQAERDMRSAQRMGDSNKIACITWRIGTKHFGTLVATGYQPRPMSQKKEQPEPSSSPSTRHVIITLPAWPTGTAH